MKTEPGAPSPPWRRIPWIGGLFIAVIVALAAYDIVRSREIAARETARELHAHARVIAEQTARSLQAVDLVLRHLAEQQTAGQLRTLGPEQLHQHLKDQLVGLVQVQALSLLDANGTLRATSAVYPLPEPAPNFSDLPGYERTKTEHGLVISSVDRSRLDPGHWIIRLSRRIDGPAGAFDGIVAASGRVSYFEEVYRGMRLDAGTQVTLMHHDGRVLVRHPPVPGSLGRQVPLLQSLIEQPQRGEGGAPLAAASPVDGVERFGAVEPVPEHPLVVMVGRDAAVALAPWRNQALGTAARTLALAALAVWLISALRRQLLRLESTHASLERSRERFELAASGSDDGIWDWDMRNDEVYASERAREIFGAAPGPQSQPRERWFASLTIHPDDIGPRRQAIAEHMAGRSPAYAGEYRVRDAAGGPWRWVRVRGLCVLNAQGMPMRMAGSVADIDARRRAEDALRLSEQRFALAVAGSDDGVWDWDFSTGMAFESARARELQGLPPGPELQPLGELVESLRVHPDDAPRRSEGIRAHLAGETPAYECEYRVRHDDGGPDGSHHRWVRVRALCIRDEAGRPVRMAGSVSDIDARKRAEVAHQRLEGQLRQAQKLEAIGTLAGGIAHDFNNILAAILGYGEMAQKSAAEGSTQRRHLDAALAAAMRAKSLVERILAFSRSGMGERVPVHVQSVVAEALDLLAASLPAGVTLVRELEGGDAAVLGDPTQVHQVVMNLCANAVQAIRGRGELRVTLARAAAAQPSCTTGPLPAGAYLRLCVRDTGSGIAPALLERIFDPFFTTKEVGVGTGLGLSLVHGIVTDLGGGIDVHSRPGEGSVFTVWLPWPIDVAAPGAAPQPQEVPPGAGQCVLLVDDEESLVRLGEELIAELGYEPVGFTSSSAALQAFRDEPGRFDAVLSDVSMPEMTGAELADALHTVRADLPVVLMSGFVTPALVQRAREAGVVEVLAKPLVAADIARSLAGALRR